MSWEEVGVKILDILAPILGDRSGHLIRLCLYGGFEVPGLQSACLIADPISTKTVELVPADG